MAENSDEAVDRPVTENERTRTILMWIMGILLAPYVLSILATRLLPQPAGTAISSILLKIAVVIFLGTLPFLEIILWKLRKALPHNGYWGLLLLLAGAEILLPFGAIIILFSTFLPALPYPFPLVLAVSVVMGIGFALIALGLLIVCIQLVWEVLRLFRNRQQVRSGDEL